MEFEIPESKALIVMGREKVLMSDFLIELDNQLGIIETTCNKLRITRKTYYNWCEKDEWFKDVSRQIIKEGNERLNDISKHSLISLILKQNVAAVIFYLKTRHPEFKETKNMDIMDQISLINYAAYVRAALDALHKEDDSKYEWQKKNEIG